MVQNKGLIFKKVPSGWPKAGEDLAVETRDFVLETAPPENGITTKNYHVSFDPYQRGRMRPAGTKSYSDPFELGQPITNSAVSKVLKSNNSKFKEGDLILSFAGTEEYSVIPGEVANDKCRKLENPYNLDPRLFLGALGMPGLTAYSSFYEIGKPKKGETIFVSAASGAVGQIVGQLAKHEGLTVIGSVGSDDKLDFIKNELKFDRGFNYKQEKATDALARLAPEGIDIYYENVGYVSSNLNFLFRIVSGAARQALRVVYSNRILGNCDSQLNAYPRVKLLTPKSSTEENSLTPLSVPSTTTAASVSAYAGSLSDKFSNDEVVACGMVSQYK